jgi:pimeloyl-ACP methyl ester carboxylesterase
VYFAIAGGLILSQWPQPPAPDSKGLDFSDLFFDYSGLPQLQTFNARDGARLSFRLYPAPTDVTLVLLHGSAWHSRYFLPLAQYISSQGLAQVYTPDLRGHGQRPIRRGDVDYIGQLEDDLIDFIAFIRRENPKARIILGGHSSGGGLALRLAGNQNCPQVEAYVLIAPYLGYDAPTVRPASGGFASAYVRRIIGLTMLNNLGLTWFNHLTVLSFNMPDRARDGTETLSYSFRLTISYAPRDYRKDLPAISQPLLVVVGTKDKAMITGQFKPLISKYNRGRVVQIPGVSHMGAVVGPEIRPVIRKWLTSLGL